MNTIGLYEIEFRKLSTGETFSRKDTPFVSYMKIEKYIYRGIGANVFNIQYAEVNAVIIAGSSSHPTGTLIFIPSNSYVFIPNTP